MNTELRTEAGVANIFEVRTGWGWTLGASEGIEDSFEAAVAAAETYASEKALKNTTQTQTMTLKSYDITGRLPMTTEARNAGATGRTHWWQHLGRVNAVSRRAACAKLRKLGQVPAAVDRLKAHSR